jgi:hypothetical protein
VQVAHVVVRREGRLQDFYLRLARRKGKKVAIVACARKLLSWIYYMLVRGEPYREEKKGLTSYKVRRMGEARQALPDLKGGDRKAYNSRHPNLVRAFHGYTLS